MGQRPPRAVEEVYAPDAVHEDLADPAARRQGHAERLEVERRLHTRLPDRAVEVLRLLELDGRQAVLECLVRGTSSTDPGRSATPALLWWWLDGEGRVCRELAWFRWRDRRPDDGKVAGTLAQPRPPGPPRPEAEAEDEVRSQSWYRAYAAHLVETWSWDPVLADRSLYDEACVVESATRPGRALRGLDALEAADTALASQLPSPHRQLQALDVLGEGRALAVRVALEGRDQGRGPLRRAYGALLLTLDGSDRVISNRSYLDWDGAVTVDDPG
ncbi:MAG: hypothetical protein GEV08_10015 [Acidimicrobiia bacterium]|nr:hypothetical protein [Acidimicrobiia bacterium]